METSNSVAGDLLEDEQPKASAKSQITIARLFFWVTLAGFAMASANTLIELFGEPYQQQANPIGIVPLVIVAATWLLFLVHHIHERSHAAIAVHTICPLLVIGVPLMFLLYEIVSGSGTIGSKQPAQSGILIPIIVATVVFSIFAGIILGVESIVSKTINKNSKPQIYLAYRVIGGIILMAFCCFVPSIFTGWFSVSTVFMGALIGFWAGLYQAMATCDWVRNTRVAGVAMRPIATAGFLGAVFGPTLGPILIRLINNSLPTIYYIPYIPFQYGTLAGFISAALIILIWRMAAIFSSR